MTEGQAARDQDLLKKIYDLLLVINARLGNIQENMSQPPRKKDRATPKQVSYILDLASRAGEEISEEEAANMTFEEASKTIEDLKAKLQYRRRRFSEAL